MLPIYAGVVPCQPRKPQDQLEMGQPGDLKGKGFRMGGMDAEPGGEVVGDGASVGSASINQLQWDGVEMWDGVQLMGDKNGGI